MIEALDVAADLDKTRIAILEGVIASDVEARDALITRILELRVEVQAKREMIVKYFEASCGLHVRIRELIAENTRLRAQLTPAAAVPQAFPARVLRFGQVALVKRWA